MGKKDETIGPVNVIDTDILIDFFRGVALATKFIKEHIDTIVFSAITETELLSGNICNDPKERENVFHLLSQFQKIPVDNPLVQFAGDVRRNYGLAVPDAIIAATALLLNATLITRNIHDFQKVKSLAVKKPY